MDALLNPKWKQTNLKLCSTPSRQSDSPSAWISKKGSHRLVTFCLENLSLATWYIIRRQETKSMYKEEVNWKDLPGLVLWYGFHASIRSDLDLFLQACLQIKTRSSQEDTPGASHAWFRTQGCPVKRLRTLRPNGSGERWATPMDMSWRSKASTQTESVDYNVRIATLAICVCM